jgi:hypothetical protein
MQNIENALSLKYPPLAIFTKNYGNEKSGVRRLIRIYDCLKYQKSTSQETSDLSQ